MFSPLTSPPYCSRTGKLYGKKPKVTPPTWKTRSSHLREDIRKYFYEDNNQNSDIPNGRTTKTFTQLGGQNSKRRNRIFLMFALTSVAIFLSLLYLRSMDEDTAPKVISYLRNTLYSQGMALAKPIITNTGIQKATKSRCIEGITLTKGELTTEWGGHVTAWGIIPLWTVAVRPISTVLTLRKLEKSDCWSFSGSYGEMNIELPRKFQIHGLSIEHVYPDTAKSAPKHLRLYGISENSTLIKVLENKYSYQGSARQYFPATHQIPFQRLILKIVSNQGNSKYTCIYRIRLYGNK